MFHSPDHTSDECSFCSTIVFDPNQTSDPASGRQLNLEDSRDSFFLGPTLDSLLAAGSSSPLAEWLVAQFKSSPWLLDNWDAVCIRGSTIKLCYRHFDGLNERDWPDQFLLVDGLVDEADDAFLLSATRIVYPSAEEGEVFHQSPFPP